MRNVWDGATGLAYPTILGGGGGGSVFPRSVFFRSVFLDASFDAGGEVRPDVDARGAVGGGWRGRVSVRGGPSRTSSIHGA